MLERLEHGAQEVAEEVLEAFVLADALHSVEAEAPLCRCLCPVDRGGSTPRARLPSIECRTTNM